MMQCFLIPFLVLSMTLGVVFSRNADCEFPLLTTNVGTFGAEVGLRKNGSKLWFECLVRGQVPHGPAEIQCLNGRWSDRVPTCEEPRMCDQPPKLANADIKSAFKSSYKHYEQVEYTCHPTYTFMNNQPHRSCLDGVWIGEPSCVRSCELPPLPPNVRLNGDIRGMQTSGSKLQIECLISGQVLRGPKEIACFDGGWNFIVQPCSEPRDCDQPPELHNGDTRNPVKSSYHHNEQVEYTCYPPNILLNSQSHRTCVDGEWVGELKCLLSCELPHLPPNVKFNGDIRGMQTSGSKVQFECLVSGQVLIGPEEVECFDGWWSSFILPCGEPGDCGQPPLLPNGDTRNPVKFSYHHNEEVEYTCQSYYTLLNNQSRRTCMDGKWVGEVRCLKPCTLIDAEMRTNNIKLLRKKLYARHNEEIQFVCLHRGQQQVLGIGMRQRCNNGSMMLPECQ